jgi:multiple sugar transport system permease protein
MKRKPSQSVAADSGAYVILITMTAVFLFPLVFMIVSSFKPESVIFSDLASLWKAFVPTKVSLVNYIYIFNRVPFFKFLFNSVFITTTAVLVGLILNSMLAFSMARLYWPGKKYLILLILALTIIPLEIVAVPMMVMVNQFPWIDGSTSWLDTYRVQIIPFMSDAFSTFLFYQFFIGQPKSFDESAKIEGASPFMIYLKITMPLSKPVFATVAILNSLNLWNSYLWPLMVTRSENVRPLTIGITALYVLNMQWGHILAFASLITIPIIILFIIFQRWFVSSVASSGIKG